MKFGRKSITQELALSKLEAVCAKHKHLEDKFLKYQKRILL